MKSSGDFIVHAELVGAGLAPAHSSLNIPSTYVNDNLEYCIEFKQHTFT